MSNDTPMTETEKLVAKIVEEHGGYPMGSLKPTDSIDSLGLDSLDQIEIVMYAEDDFEIEIPDDEAEKCTTVAELAATIERLKEQA